MANALHDDNRNTTLLAESSVSATTSLALTATPIASVNPLNVAIVDGTGTQITSFGGGTQYTEDAAAAANPIGTAPMLVRTDTPAGQTTTDGDNIAQRATNYGAAYVQVVNSSGSYVDTFGGGVQYTEGDTDVSITGTAAMMEGAANTLLPVQGTVADGLLVNLGTNNDVAATLSAETTKVIGTVNIAAAQTVAAVTAITNALPAGNNNIGDVDVASIAAGNNNIGDVDIASGTLTAVTTVTNVGAGNVAATIAADGVTPTVPGIAAYSFVKTPGANTWDRTYSVVNATDTVGTGIPAAGILAQFDDVAPGTVTENRFGNVRMSVRREVYSQIRDAAGNERGAVVDANGALAAVVTQGTATNLKTQAEAYQGGAAVAAGNPLLVSLANTAANGTAVKVNVASGGIASGAVASGAIASGAVASGAFASGALASGSIAAGAIAVGATSIADNEDVASAGADTMVKIAQIRQDTPVANAGVSNDGDYLNFRADNFGKTWVTGTVPEDTAHVAGEALMVQGSRRIATLATSSGSDADWSTVNQTAEGAAWTSLAATATPNGLLVGNFTSGDTYTALTATAQVIKASAGNLYGYYIYNPNATASYVMIYNIAAASVTVGTSTAILVFCIPATSAANLMFPVPIPFSNAGWSIAAATTGGGNTAPTTALEAMVFYL